MNRKLAWVVLHFAPLAFVALATNALTGSIGESPAAGVALFGSIGIIATGQSYILRPPNSRRWMLQTAGGIGIAVGVAIFLISTIDLAGYDAAATLTGMTAGGLTLGLIQSRLVENRTRWILLSTLGWLVAAIVFRAIIPALSSFAIGDIKPWGLAYNEGHNELLWSSTGLAFYGCITAPGIVAQ